MVRECRQVRMVVWVLALGGAALALAASSVPADRSVGLKVDDFRLADPQGKEWSLHRQAGKKAVVIVFVSSECPMSNAYLKTLADLASSYESKGVSFVAINANAGEDAKAVAAHAKEFKVPFPMLRDEKQAAVAALKAEINPEAFVLDGNFVLRYRGRIDDGYSARLRKKNLVTRHDLKEAIEEVLAGKAVSLPLTQAFGCPIDFNATPRSQGPLGNAEPRSSASPTPTFNKDVMPILQNHCQSCHRSGSVAPFSLMTYKQATRWGGDIKEFTQNRKMPPWKPVNSHGVFQNERRLSDAELATLARWVDGGMPEGDAKDLPPARQFKDGWTLGEPDLVLTVPQEMTVGASGRDLFRVFVLPTSLTEDRHVRAVEVKPGNARVVHHTLNFIDTTGQGRKLEKEWQEANKDAGNEDRGPGYTVAMGVGFLPRGGVGGWAPGQVPRFLPDGVGYYLPKGADLVLQVHYHRTGKIERDQVSIGLYFAKKPVTHRFQTTVTTGRFPFFGIPAGKDQYKIDGEMWIDRDITLYTVMPHMHLLGKSIKATMTLPDGTARTLVNITDWDYNWQETYYLKEPIKAPAGTKFAVEAFYDNSESNPLNPFTPPRNVRFGEQTTNEMCFVFLGCTTDQPGRVRPSPTPPKDTPPKGLAGQ